ncbi:MAG: alpha/beta hydrolase [Acidobacteriota bacterium]|nr:MAG: alpha/beta hydrolase [Acidobacteriota bacterium]
MSITRHSIEAGMFVRERAAAAEARATLVWIHGLGESGLCFEQIVTDAELAATRHLVADLPGYGRSAWPEIPATLTETADRLAGWLVRRGEPPSVLVGHSMGGVIALLLAERHPQLVLALIDIDGNKSIDDCSFSEPAARASAESFRARGFESLKEQVYRDGARDEALRGYYVSLRLADPVSYHAHARELVALSLDERLADRLAALRLPALFVAGVPRGVSERSRELLARAGVRCALVTESGHWPFIDRPRQFTAAIESWLSEVLED